MSTQPKQPTIFLSIGRPLSQEQIEFKLALIAAVKARGFLPRTVGQRDEDTDVPHARPIEQIQRLIRECNGAIVVAYEKHWTDKLRTNSLAPTPGELSHVRLSTSWNQAEAAMSYHAGLPLLLVSEDGVFGECLLEDGVIGSVARVEIRESAVWSSVFQRRMDSWAKDVTEHMSAGKVARLRGADAEQLTIVEVFQILGSLNWKSVLTLCSGSIGLLVAAYSLGVATAHLWKP